MGDKDWVQLPSLEIPGQSRPCLSLFFYKASPLGEPRGYFLATGTPDCFCAQILCCPPLMFYLDQVPDPPVLVLLPDLQHLNRCQVHQTVKGLRTVRKLKLVCTSSWAERKVWAMWRQLARLSIEI